MVMVNQERATEVSKDLKMQKKENQTRISNIRGDFINKLNELDPIFGISIGKNLQNIEKKLLIVLNEHTHYATSSKTGGLMTYRQTLVFVTKNKEILKKSFKVIGDQLGIKNYDKFDVNGTAWNDLIEKKKYDEYYNFYILIDRVPISNVVVNAAKSVNICSNNKEDDVTAIYFNINRSELFDTKIPSAHSASQVIFGKNHTVQSKKTNLFMPKGYVWKIPMNNTDVNEIGKFIKVLSDFFVKNQNPNIDYQGAIGLYNKSLGTKVGGNDLDDVEKLANDSDTSDIDMNVGGDRFDEIDKLSDSETSNNEVNVNNEIKKNDDSSEVEDIHEKFINKKKDEDIKDGLDDISDSEVEEIHEKFINKKGGKNDDLFISQNNYHKYLNDLDNTETEIN